MMRDYKKKKEKKKRKTTLKNKGTASKVTLFRVYLVLQLQYQVNQRQEANDVVNSPYILAWKNLLTSYATYI